MTPPDETLEQMLKRTGVLNSPSRNTPVAQIRAQSSTTVYGGTALRPISIRVPADTTPFSLHFAPVSSIADIVTKLPGISRTRQQREFFGGDSDEVHRFTTLEPSGIVCVQGNRYCNQPAFMRVKSYLQLVNAPTSAVEFHSYKNDPSTLISNLVSGLRSAIADRNNGYIVMTETRQGKYVVLDISDNLLYGAQRTVAQACTDLNASLQKL